jgi:capsular exopolysaccharide synthesis family protein
MNARAIEESLNLEHVLDVVRRRWWVVVVCVVLTSGSALVLSASQRKQYTASASLVFGDPGFAEMVFGSNFAAPATDPTIQAATNISLVSLPTMAALTSKALGGRLTPEQVGAAVSVGSVGQGGGASISATEPGRSLAARVANTYAEQYILSRQAAERSQIAGAQAQIQNELAGLTPQQKTGAVGQSLLNRANELRLLAALQTGNAELVQRATAPTSPSSPQTKRNTIFGALLGLVLGFGLVFLIDRLDSRLHDLAAVEDAYGLPILAAVPYSPALRLVRRTDQLPAEAEAFGLLRARLRYFNVDRDVRSLLITSALPGDGKTTVALNLAVAAALGGSSRVLLVEADLRRPTLARTLDIESGPGLAEVISRSISLTEALQWVPVHRRSNGSGPIVGFDVLVAGAIPPNPAEQMESQSMKKLLTTINGRFDLVIIDTPPVSVVSDAIPMMRQVSGVVVVSRIGKTSRDAAIHLGEELRRLDAPTLGVVANGVPSRGRDHYTYGYGYANELAHAAEPNGAQQGRRAVTTRLRVPSDADTEGAPRVRTTGPLPAEAQRHTGQD